MNRLELKEYIWERCEMDDHKTREIMVEIRCYISEQYIAKESLPSTTDIAHIIAGTSRNHIGLYTDKDYIIAKSISQRINEKK